MRTSQVRTSIINFLQATPHPVTVPQLQRNLSVNKTSIYRQILALLQAQQIVELDFSDGVKHYELASQSHHHHLVCLKCQAIQDVQVPENFISHLKITNFTIIRHSLEFFGLCRACA
jgi:Fe2+ or Zn2+ uptake regulation protein